MSEKPKEIFVKNRHRELLSKLNNQREFQTEHDRLDRSPQVNDVSEDFRYARRRPLVVSSRKRQEHGQEPTQVRPPRPPHMAVASGHNEELSWVPRPIEAYNQDPNRETIEYDDIPEPPPVSYTPQHEEPEPPSQEVRIDDIAEGNYFVVVADTIVAEAPEIGLLEELIEQTIFDNQNGITLDDIVVLRKMRVRVGVSVE